MIESTGESDRPTAGPPILDLVFRPFAYIAGGRSLLIGLAAIVLAGLLGGLSGTHFDGVLDVHSGPPVPTPVFLAEGIVNWLSAFIVLFLLGKAVSRTRFRALDLLGTQAMARWPTLLAALATLGPPYRRLVATLSSQILQGGPIQVPRADVVLGGLLMFVVALAVVWMVALMYHSYALCCNIRGPRAALTFIAALIGAEVISKVIVVRILIS